MRFTQQLQRVHPNVLAKQLNRGILHQDKDLVVINKPYGLPVHGKNMWAKESSLLLLLPPTTRVTSEAFCVKHS